MQKMNDLKKLKEVAVSAAVDAGRLLKTKLKQARKIEFKGEIDLVTEMDRASEDLIIGRFRSSFPDIGILTEESDEIQSLSKYRWIIDPLDGTTNYAHGFPFFCVSIALEENRQVVLGVVYDPNFDELFIAEKGKGSFLNGEKISPSTTNRISDALLATGFPYDIRRSKQNNIEEFSRFALVARAIRRPGSAVLDLCYVACGRSDGFWELKLQPWDMAAGSLIITEAGGMITDLRGAPFCLNGKNILASNGRIHHAMLEVLNQG